MHQPAAKEQKALELLGKLSWEPQITLIPKLHKWSINALYLMNIIARQLISIPEQFPNLVYDHMLQRVVNRYGQEQNGYELKYHKSDHNCRFNWITFVIAPLSQSEAFLH